MDGQNRVFSPTQSTVPTILDPMRDADPTFGLIPPPTTEVSLC